MKEIIERTEQERSR